MNDLYVARPPLSADEERDLSLRAQAGDRDAQEEMVRAVVPLIRSMACRTGVYGAGFDDLVQEATVAAWRAIQRFDASKGSWPGWVVKHSFHAIGHALPDEPTASVPVEDVAAPVVDEEEAASREQSGAALRAGLRLVLGEDTAEIVYLRAVEDFSETQVAKRLRKSWRKVRIVYASGLARLRAVAQKATA